MLVIEHSSTPYWAEQSSHFTQFQISSGLLNYHLWFGSKQTETRRGDQSSVNLIDANSQILGAKGNNQEGLEVMLPEREL